MRIIVPFGERESYIDRRIARIIRYYNSDDMPKSYWTTVWSYTVPSGRLFYIEFIYLKVIRIMSAEAARVGQISLELIPSGGNAIEMYYLELYNNIVFEYVDRVITNPGILEPGDQIRCRVFDTSIGGYVGGRAYMHGFEFAA